MKRILFAVLLTGLVGVNATAWAEVTAENPWVRATVGPQTAAGAFMRLHANEQARLVDAHSPAAKIVEIHEMKMDGNVMKMRALPDFTLKAGETAELKAGGLHVMLTDLAQPLKEGEKVPVTLVFETVDKKRQTLEITIPVQPLTSKAGHTKPSGHAHSH